MKLLSSTYSQIHLRAAKILFCSAGIDYQGNKYGRTNIEKDDGASNQVKSSDLEERVNHSAADKVSEATQVVSRGSARPRYLRVSNGHAPRKQLCTRYRQMKDQRQSNGVLLVPYQSSSESDSDES